MEHKRGYTLKGHEARGLKLKEVRRFILQLYLEMDARYGEDSPESRAIHRLTKALDHFRCVMDDAAFAEHPEALTAQLAEIYYGAGEVHRVV